MDTHGGSVWKLCLGGLILLFFMEIGVGHMLYPDYFMKRTTLRRGGEMLTGWNRTGYQFVGLMVAGFSGWVLYQLAHDLLSR